MDERSYTRRILLKRGGLAAATFGAASALGTGLPARAFGADEKTLSPERRRTYVALVEAVALAGTTEVVASESERAADEFAALYADGQPALRQGVNNVLDMVESGEPGKSFSNASARERLRRLRQWHEGNDSGELRGRRWSWPAFTCAAVNYAALPFYPHGIDDPPILVTI